MYININNPNVKKQKTIKKLTMLRVPVKSKGIVEEKGEEEVLVGEEETLVVSKGKVGVIGEVDVRNVLLRRMLLVEFCAK